MHIKPKKSLGQNFLFDKNIQAKIINACGLKESDTVLEIGSGTGQMTRLIAEKVNKVYAVEIDSRLLESARAYLKDRPNVTIINQDILQADLNAVLGNGTARIKVIGNIPYYITTPIIERLIFFRGIIDAVFITVQKEFAKRIVAVQGSKDYGSFSCFVQYYIDPKILFFIKKASFFPIPKIDSCLLRLIIRGKPEVEAMDEEQLFKIIKSAFCKRRKTLANSLKGIVAPETMNLFFDKYAIARNARPENLRLKDFINLSSLVVSEKPQPAGF